MLNKKPSKCFYRPTHSPNLSAIFLCETSEVLREIDGGAERITVGLPAIFTADLRLNEPRYGKFRSQMIFKIIHIRFELPFPTS